MTRPAPGGVWDPVEQLVDALLEQSARPPIGQLIRSAETYLLQALAVLEREYDPASLGGVPQAKADLMLTSVAGFVGFARTGLATLAEDGALAPVGSAVYVPGARRNTEETDGPRTAATDGALNTESQVEER